MPGLIRDRYEPLEVVGRGGQGQVVRALDRLHDRVVAIKIRAVPPERQALLSEARILLTLRPHPNVSLVREDFFEGDRYYLVMDWVEGKTLHSMIAERGDPGLPLDEALRYLTDVAEALQHLHGHDPPIVHKDVKPANVIVTPSGSAVLVDFGIAAGGGAGSRGSLGTRGYTAPELVTGAATTPSADVFGLAATAFALLTGGAPRVGRRPRWKGMPKEHARLIDLALQRGLAFDPARRPASAADLVASMRTGPSIPNNLPLQLTSFIGRAAEIDDVGAHLERSRLVTLTGPGGIGKTRLALSAAAESMSRFPDGVWLVELAAVSEAERVTQALASVVGVREAPGVALDEALVSHLTARRALLVVDNCEHLVEASASLIRSLLASCPDVRAIATSRESLGVPGEAILRVPPLGVPTSRGLPVEAVAATESVALFLDRAQLVQPAFALREDNAAVVAQLCERLEGIPLAIELAAARVRSLSPAEIADRLDDRFRLLAVRKGGTDRQHSLRAVVDWSYDLLDEDERTLLQSLSVFAGGFTLEAAEAVEGSAYDIADGLAQLVDKSLVTLDDASERARYGMLETIRTYAEERLHGSGRLADVRARHGEYFTGLALAAEPGLEGPDQAHWLDVLEDEHGNLRLALAWSLDDPAGSDRALRTAAALWRMWDMRGYLTEGRAWLQRALEREADAPVETRAKAFRAAGGLALDQGDYDAARAMLERSLSLARASGSHTVEAAALNGLAIAAGAQSEFDTERALYLEALRIWRAVGNKRGIALTLGNLGTGAFEQGDAEAARSYLDESLAIRRELGDRQGIAQSLNGLALVAGAVGDAGRERSLFEESLAIWRELGYKRGVAIALLNLGTAALVHDENTRARSMLEESITILRELGIKWDLAESLHVLGDLAHADGDLDLAAARYEEALEIRMGLGDKRGGAESLEAAAGLAAGRGRHEDAACVLGAAHALREAIGVPPAAIRRAAIERDETAARSALGVEAFDAAWKRGLAMTLEEARRMAVAAARGA